MLLCCASLCILILTRANRGIITASNYGSKSNNNEFDATTIAAATQLIQ